LAFANELLEVSVARPAAGIFKVPVIAARERGHVLAREQERHIQFACQIGDEGFIHIRCVASQSMIQMHDAKRNTEIGAQFVKKPQQRDRIGAARYANTDAVAGREHPVVANRLRNALMELRFHGYATGQQESLQFYTARCYQPRKIKKPGW
jgi:hypothetical protein